MEPVKQLNQLMNKRYIGGSRGYCFANQGPGTTLWSNRWLQVIKLNILLCIKGHILCKTHFCMAFQHKYVSPVCLEIPREWEKIFSLFLLVHLSEKACSTTPVRFSSPCDILRGLAPPTARWHPHPLENLINVPPSCQLKPAPVTQKCWRNEQRTNCSVVGCKNHHRPSGTFIYFHHLRMWRPRGFNCISHSFDRFDRHVVSYSKIPTSVCVLYVLVTSLLAETNGCKETAW